MKKTIDVFEKKSIKSFYVYVRVFKKGTSKPDNKQTRCITIKDYTGKLTSDKIIEKFRGIKW